MLVPDPEKEQEDFLIRSEETRVSSQENLEEISQPEKTPAAPEISEILSDDELDLSDITHKEKSREDIIAEAEAQAFAES